ncbi:MAG: type II toxin-antitoxin system Phd/YefM family antitoxin [Oscillospiraceae bacterium]|nr:type II toxin-antitoxin system Phd/YefM family antitoxin [Oscillospiraceae bacterium]MDE6932834.1 type II toxin-antitoxin system Phd/YefM family antitoxin [Oscillospiraceae bacterium]MDE7041153.1 type II toxin-antitoxin system Phd/YefM family antitoxin [Oscillospiraceae bacterium]
MTVTAAEFHANFGKYLAMLSGGDIFITQNGKTIAKLVKPAGSAVDAISGLLEGKLPEELDAKALRGERLERYAVDD